MTRGCPRSLPHSRRRRRKTDASAHWPRPPAPSPRSASFSQSTIPRGTREARIRSLCVCVFGGEGGVGERGQAGVSVGDYGGAENEVRGGREGRARFLFLCSHSLAPPPLSAYTGSRERPLSEPCTEGPLHDTTTDPRTQQTGGLRARCALARTSDKRLSEGCVLLRRLLEVDEPRLRNGAVLPVSIVSGSPMAVAVLEAVLEAVDSSRCSSLRTTSALSAMPSRRASPALFFGHATLVRSIATWTTCRVSAHLRASRPAAPPPS